MRRGGVLLEVLVSLALFVGAASFVLASMRSSLTALDRAQKASFAVDLGRTRLAELELGLITMSDLREDGAGPDELGSLELEPEDLERWSIEADTERTEYTGLTLVTLTVRELDAEGLELEEGGVVVELRQLVRLREEDVDAFEQDELLEGLPTGTAGGAR